MDHLLLTAQEIAEATTFEINIDERRLDAFTPVAQGKRLRPILGGPLYEALLGAVQAATEEEPLAEPWVSLLAAVKPMLSWWTVATAWPVLQVHLTNAGITMRTGRESTSADVKISDAALDGYRSTAEFHAGELATWLTNNSATYAQWLTTSPPPPFSTEEPPLPGGIYFD